MTKLKQGEKNANNQKNLAKICQPSPPELRKLRKQITPRMLANTISATQERKWPDADTAFFFCKKINFN